MLLGAKFLLFLATVSLPSVGNTHGDPLPRDEHLVWCKRCKRRALEYFDAGDLRRAVAGMVSDLKTRPDTYNPAVNRLVMTGVMYVADADEATVWDSIEHFR